MTRLKTLGICFGAFAPPLADQLAEQSLSIGEDAVLERLERARISIAFLNLHGFIADSEADKARKRLMKSIVAEIEKTKYEASMASPP